MMPTIPVRIFLIYNFLNSFVLYLIPKKLRGLLPQSWYPPHRLDDDNLNKNPPELLTPSPPPSRIPRRMDTAELKRVFQMFDKNGDGRISKEELNDSLENLGIFIPERDLIQMIQKIDVNGDGCVDVDEFGSLYNSIVDENEGEDDMRDAFDVFDENGDGFITVDELKSVLASLGLKQGKTLDDCRKMIMTVDVDGDGRVSYKEFRQMMKGGGLSAALS